MCECPCSMRDTVSVNTRTTRRLSRPTWPARCTYCSLPIYKIFSLSLRRARGTCNGHSIHLFCFCLCLSANMHTLVHHSNRELFRKFFLKVFPFLLFFLHTFYLVYNLIAFWMSSPTLSWLLALGPIVLASDHATQSGGPHLKVCLD